MNRFNRNLKKFWLLRNFSSNASLAHRITQLVNSKIFSPYFFQKIQDFWNFQIKNRSMSCHLPRRVRPLFRFPRFRILGREWCPKKGFPLSSTPLWFSFKESFKTKFTLKLPLFLSTSLPVSDLKEWIARQMKCSFV